MRIPADHDALARMVARHVEAHHQTSATAARRLADVTPKASDDAAGVAIATRMQARVASAAAASHNVQDGISLMQVADGALTAMTEYLQRVRVVALQSANGTFADSQRHALQVGVDGLLRGFDDLLRSLGEGGRVMQVGIDAGDTMSLPEGPAGERSWAVSVADAPAAKSALEVLDEALEELYAHRAAVGAAQNRLERILGNLGVQSDAEHVSASRITDADLGQEVVQLLKSRTWAQAGAQMLTEVQVAGRRALELLLASVPDADEGEADSASAPAHTAASAVPASAEGVGHASAPIVEIPAPAAPATGEGLPTVVNSHDSGHGPRPTLLAAEPDPRVTSA